MHRIHKTILKHVQSNISESSSCPRVDKTPQNGTNGRYQRLGGADERIDPLPLGPFIS